MVVLMLIERETLQVFFFLHISQMLNVSIFGNTADIYALVHLVPHACQHFTVNQSHNSGDMVAKILEISGEWKYVKKKNLESFYQHKNCHDPLSSLLRIF